MTMTNKYKIRCNNEAFYSEIKFCLEKARIPFAQKDDKRPVVCRASKDKEVLEAFSNCLINEDEYSIHKKVGEAWIQMEKNAFDLKKEEDELEGLSDRAKRIYHDLQNGETLSESDLSYLVCNFELDDEREVGDNRRWTRSVCSIIELGGKHYSITWEEGLTENQENYFYDQPVEVEMSEYEKTIVVREWNPVNKDKDEVDR